MPDPKLHRPLQAEHRALERARLLRVALRAAAWCAAILAAAVAAGAILGLGPGGAWTRLILVAAAGLAAVGFAASNFGRETLRFDAWLERIERSFPEVRSWLRNALDLETSPPQHSSDELALAVRAETARRLREVPLAALRPRVGALRPLLTMAGALVAILAMAALSPARVERSWKTLWNPGAAAPPVRLEVEPGSVTVTPGATLAVRARVWGSARTPRLLRDQDAAVSASLEGETEDGGRRWRFDLPPLTREQNYRVRAERVESPRYHIALAGDPAPVSFEIEYHPPAYARLPVQKGATTRGDLSALRGSRARIEVTFDRDLTRLSAALPGSRTIPWAQLSPRRWRAELPVDREVEYRLDAIAASGAASFRYRIMPLPDAPPQIVVRTPQGDLDLPAGQQIPLEILGEDDLGLSELRLQFHKAADAPWTDTPLTRFEGAPREARFESHWDAGVLGLLPGESASFRFVLYDNNAVSGRGRAESPTFELRFPSLADLYEHLDQNQQQVQGTLEKVAEQAHELQKSLDKLGQQPQQRSAPQNQPSPQFERNEELRKALERQQELAQKIEDASKQMQQTLAEASERSAFNQQLTTKLQEMNELMRQIQSPEFKEALRKMQEAMRNMDHRPLEQNLQDWRRQNREMLSNLERTLALLKRLREEEQLQALAKRADELKAQQDALNSQHEAPKTGSPEQRAEQAKALSEQQQAAAKASESLANDARALAKQLEEQEKPAQEKLGQAGDTLSSQAAPAQQSAAQSAEQQQGQSAKRSGQRASQSLEQAAEMLHGAAQQMQDQRESADLAAVRRSAQDLVSLEHAAEQNLEANQPLHERADRQSDLSEGVARVADSLGTLARQTPFITPRLSEALGRAMNDLSNSGHEMSGGNRQRGEAAAREAGGELNVAVLELRKSEQGMCNKPGGSRPNNKPGASEAMGGLGQQQGQLNRDTQSIAQRLSQQMRLSAGDRNEMQRLAEEQARIRGELEQIQRDDESKHQLLGRLDQAHQQMQEVEEALRQGETDPSVEQKQTQILSRMLDAQRSINRRDFDPERESRPGEDLARRSPAELPPEMLRENDRLRLDLLKAEADRYPAQYRAYIEAYLKSLNASRR